MKAIPIFRAEHIQPHLALLRGAGVGVDRYWKDEGLPSLLDVSSSMYLPLINGLNFLETVAAAEGIEDLAYNACQNIHNITLDRQLVASLATEPTLYSALKKFCTLSYIEDNSLMYWFKEAGNSFRIYSRLNIRCDHLHLRYSEWSQNMALAQIVEHLTGEDWYPDEMGFSSTFAVPAIAQNSHPNTQFITHQNATWITIDKQTLSQHLSCSVRNPSSSLTKEPPSFSNALKKLLRPYLNAGHPNIAVAARISGSSVRTFQRRLKELGFNYSDIVHQAKYELATDMLRDCDIKIIEIAQTVGYDDASNFARAFKRSTGVSPRKYRENLCAPATVSRFGTTREAVLNQ